MTLTIMIVCIQLIIINFISYHFPLLMDMECRSGFSFPNKYNYSPLAFSIHCTIIMDPR